MDCRKISWMVDNSVAGVLTVGRYPVASAITYLCTLVRMLNPLQKLIVFSDVLYMCTKTHNKSVDMLSVLHLHSLQLGQVV